MPLSLNPMKIAASILALLILFLSTQCLVDPSFMEKKASPARTHSCCSKRSGCKRPEKKEAGSGCKDYCNPFMACSGCAYVVFEKAELVIDNPLIIAARNGYHTDNFISGYSSSAWHPPRFI